MSITSHSASVFPTSYPEDGLTKRELFAAMAPTEIPSWFDAMLPTVAEQTNHLRTTIIDEHIQNARLRKAIQDWRRDPCFDLEGVGETSEERAFLRDYERAFEQYEAACEVARRQNEIGRYFAWRAFYADKLLAALEGE